MARKYAKKTRKTNTRKRTQRKKIRNFRRKTAIIRNPLSQQSLMVPLQYPFAYDINTTTTGDGQFIYSGSSYPNCFGDISSPVRLEMPVGLAQYGGAYNSFRVHGSNINVTFTNLDSTINRIGLMALPYDSSTSGVGSSRFDGAGSGSWAGVDAGTMPNCLTSAVDGALASYYTLPYVDVMNEPFIKWKTIMGTDNTRNTVRFVSSRKTKNMVNVKDIKDSGEFDNDVISTEPDSSVDNLKVAAKGFVWYTKIDATEPCNFRVSGKITYWVEFFNRFITKNPDYNFSGPTGMGPI